jgi:hypothetical protein
VKYCRDDCAVLNTLTANEQAALQSSFLPSIPYLSVSVLCYRAAIHTQVESDPITETALDRLVYQATTLSLFPLCM